MTLSSLGPSRPGVLEIGRGRWPSTRSVTGWACRGQTVLQVLQTDIESHGRIVKLVLGLCEELSQDPGLYDLQVSQYWGCVKS